MAKRAEWEINKIGRPRKKWKRMGETDAGKEKNQSCLESWELKNTVKSISSLNCRLEI